MKTKKIKKDKVNVITLGCSKNLADSEVLMGQLSANGIDVSHESSEPANIVVINTCGFIDLAKQESIDTIVQYADIKSCLLYTSPSPRDRTRSRMPSSA